MMNQLLLSMYKKPASVFNTTRLRSFGKKSAAAKANAAAKHQQRIENKAHGLKECYWARPDEGFLKMNLDGGFINKKNNPEYQYATCAAIVRDGEGDCKFTTTKNLGHIGKSGVHFAETQALKLGLKVALEKMATDDEYKNIQIETDCQNLVDWINGPEFLTDTTHSCYNDINDCKKMIEERANWKITKAHRDANDLADALARRGFSLDQETTDSLPEEREPPVGLKAIFDENKLNKTKEEEKRKLQEEKKRLEEEKKRLEEKPTEEEGEEE